MTNKGLAIVGVGLLLVAGGLLTLWWPVFLDTYDQWGFQIKCGNGFGSDLTQASIAQQAMGTGYVADCNSALAARRAWGIPVTGVGVLVLGWLVTELWRHAELVSTDAADDDA